MQTLATGARETRCSARYTAFSPQIHHQQLPVVLYFLVLRTSADLAIEEPARPGTTVVQGPCVHIRAPKSSTGFLGYRYSWIQLKELGGAVKRHDR